MSESIPSVCKTISWILAILLIGTIALYNWYIKNQNSVLAAKETRIAESAQRVTIARRELDQSKETLATLRSENQALSEELTASEQANQTLQKQSGALETKHTEALAAERKKAHQAYAELQGQYDAANEQIAALGDDIKRLSREMASAAKAHETRLAQSETAHEAMTRQIEQELNKKVDYYRIALEGSNPERAAQLATQEQKIQDSQLAIKEAMRAMQALQEKGARLEEQLADANRSIAERDKTLSETDRALEAAQAALAQEQSALSTLQQERDATVANLRQKLQTANAADEKAQALIDELRGSLESNKQTLTRVEAKLNMAEKAAVRAQKSHDERIAEAQSKIADLDKSLQQARQQAAQDLAASQREGKEVISHLREMFTEFSQLGGRQTDQGILLSLAEGDVRFRISQADLPEGKLPILDKIAGILEKHPKLTARIEGHTDNTGRDETNL